MAGPVLAGAKRRLANLSFTYGFFWMVGPGVKTHRTWVIAPDIQSLEERWDALRREKDPEKKQNLFHPDRDRYLSKVVTVDLGSHHVRSVTVAQDQGPVVSPCRYAFRSFDREWIVPDHRLLSMARPELWAVIRQAALLNLPGSAFTRKRARHNLYEL